MSLQVTLTEGARTMNRGIYQIINYFFAADVPWHFRLLVVMVLIFFGGGLYLDNVASQISLTLPEQAASLTQGAASDSLPELQIKALQDHTKNKVDNLSSSAKLLYDFSKIALGALLASLSSVISGKAPSTPKPEPDKGSTNKSVDSDKE